MREYKREKTQVKLKLTINFSRLRSSAVLLRDITKEQKETI